LTEDAVQHHASSSSEEPIEEESTEQQEAVEQEPMQPLQESEESSLVDDASSVSSASSGVSSLSNESGRHKTIEVLPDARFRVPREICIPTVIYESDDDKPPPPPPPPTILTLVQTPDMARPSAPKHSLPRPPTISQRQSSLFSVESVCTTRPKRIIVPTSPSAVLSVGSLVGQSTAPTETSSGGKFVASKRFLRRMWGKRWKAPRELQRSRGHLM